MLRERRHFGVRAGVEFFPHQGRMHARVLESAGALPSSGFNWFAQNPAGERELALDLSRRDEAASPTEALAYLRMAEYGIACGRLVAAQAASARLASLDPARALVDEVYQSLATHLHVHCSTLEAWRDSWLRWNTTSVPGIVPSVEGSGVELQWCGTTAYICT